ncbi:MAG: response regulator [Anaerolineae bacterium]|nr:response regulator [Anaerolineae bacterium]
MLSETDSDFASATAELLQSTSRYLILVTGGVYLTWHVLATVGWPDELGLQTWLVSLTLVPAYALALYLISRHFLIAQMIWLAGLAVAITFAIYMFQLPEIGFLYSLLPLIAVITLGWPAGVFSEIVITALAWRVLPRLLVWALPTGYPWAIVAGGAFTGLVGWAATRALFTVTRWSLFSFAQARENMERARQHRAQAVQLLKNLDQAYYRLERANAALVAAWKAADEAERFKAEFVTNVSHELRTPLNLIVGFSEMMMTSPESYGGVQLPGPYRSDLNAIYHSARHLLALVDDVLDLARIEVGKIALVREEVDLASLVEEAADIVRDYIAAKGLELRVHVEDGLPALWVDRLRIRQVLLNLLVNAARFTERGWIGVDVSRQGDEVVVRVTDTGRGIPAQDLPKVFEEFRSTEHPISQWHSGTGLGLPISKKFVELHHGRMGVESTYRQGTTFWFTLPCSPTLAVGPRPSHGGRSEPVVRLGASERIIVVVHDDPHVASLLQRYLDGYRVVGVSDWKEAVTLVEDIKPIALMTDDGEVPPSLPDDLLVIRCSLPSGRRVAAALGADDLLVKPVSRQELLAAIDRVGRPVRRVLIADDDPEIVRLFRRMLRPRIPARDCLEAYNGEEALRLVREERPDLVLLDLVMPGTDGQGVLEQMSADPELADIPVIIVSAHAQDHTDFQLSSPIWLSKARGFQLGELVRALEATLGALSPGWQRLSSREPEPAEAPVGSPASASSSPPPTPEPAGAH